ncbi:MAG: sigma-70 family RNA polymerase sigma factor [Isosphaeraceae bacterium]
MMTQSINYRCSPAECRAAGSGPIERVGRILGRRLAYIDHPSFNDPNARDAILAPLTHTVDDPVSRRSEPSRWRTTLSNGPSEAPLLSREQEAHLFRKMNYLKCRANQLKEQLDPDRPSPADLDEIERLQSEALAVKNRIVEMNLRLVVSIAKTRVRAGYDLSECVSDGNLALILAVDGFDFSRGYKFSTYATWAIRNELGRNDRRSIRLRRHPFTAYEASLTAPGTGVDTREREEVLERRRSVVRRWLRRLNTRERRILASRYGIGGAPRQSLAKIGQELGISRERVRQIADRAKVKLRKIARLEAREPLDI